VEAHGGVLTDPRRVLARARLAWEQHREDEALALAELLLATDVAPDAAYLAGYIHGQRDTAPERARSRVLLEAALRDYQRAHRHADSSSAANFLSRLARADSRFSEELGMAQQSVAEAEQSPDTRVLGRATAALAEAYDWIGMAEAARESFLHAEQLTKPWPAELAYIYVKHAEFLIDLGTLKTSLLFLDKAAETCARAVASGREREVSQLAITIGLNRADALLQLGRLDDADREIAAARQAAGDTPEADPALRIRVVEGYVAARRGDLARAEELFAVDEDSLNGDYRWRIAFELARSYRAAGQLARAEDAYRTAIAVVEKLRRAAAGVQLRPWVLARRTLPYVELLALLVEQQRGVDALVIAESLHARAWLDTVLGPGADRDPTAERAVTVARIRQLAMASTPPLDAPSLMATIGAREALVFLPLGEVTWRAHVARGTVTFDRLAGDEIELAHRFSATPDDPLASEQASAVLLPADLSDSSEPLYVIATGQLADVPFVALRRHGRYLVQERSIARLPGLAVLRAGPASWDDRAIVLGDSRHDLPAAAREVRSLAATLGVPASVGDAASRQLLVSARHARILHIATHGVTTPSGRAIVLADGDFTAADVLEARLDPQIVVLSGCATAASDDAESWDGFPSAFLAAGSRYVVATLRSVDDAQAARVSQAYYAQPACMNPIERLAAAQRQLASVLPVAAWASFAAWGSAGCEDAPGCSGSPRASSSSCDAIVRAGAGAPVRGPGAIPGGPGALRGGGGRPERGSAQR
jgi:tetratricopeptide (TPR) repeat protein